LSLIVDRPQRWNEVIGQARALRVLHAVLRNPRFMTRGLIFAGPYAVGKTTCAYLFARALMCLSDDPLGCEKCPSCLVASRRMFTDPELNHPAFIEVDAASHSGVVQARALMDTLDGGATLGRRYVVLIDEAHRLSVEAWDVFLKPLEAGDTSVIFLFVTSEEASIPATILSRCATLIFGMVSTEDLMGKLIAVADQQGIDYTHEGIRMVAAGAKGRPRDAVKDLGLVAAVGKVDGENVDSVLNQDTTTICTEVYMAVLREDLLGSVSKGDELSQRIGPVKVIETLFSLFAKDVFNGARIARGFAPLGEMTRFFLKWSRPPHLPSDIIPLFILELSDMRSSVFKASAPSAVADYARVPPPAPVLRTSTPDRAVHANEFRKMMEN